MRSGDNSTESEAAAEFAVFTVFISTIECFELDAVLGFVLGKERLTAFPSVASQHRAGQEAGHPDLHGAGQEVTIGSSSSLISIGGTKAVGLMGGGISSGEQHRMGQKG